MKQEKDNWTELNEHCYLDQKEVVLIKVLKEEILETR